MKKLQLKKEVVERLDYRKMRDALGGADVSLALTGCEICQTNASFRVGEFTCTQGTDDTNFRPKDDFFNDISREAMGCGSAPIYTNECVHTIYSNCC